MKIIDYIYIIENKNDICIKDGWHVEMYDTDSKEKTSDKRVIWEEIKEIEKLSEIEDKNIQYHTQPLMFVSIFHLT